MVSSPISGTWIIDRLCNGSDGNLAPDPLLESLSFSCPPRSSSPLERKTEFELDGSNKGSFDEQGGTFSPSPSSSFLPGASPVLSRLTPLLLFTVSLSRPTTIRCSTAASRSDLDLDSALIVCVSAL